MGRIRKPPIEATGRVHVQRKLPEDCIKFSFRFLDLNHPRFDPSLGNDGYLACLLERLRDVSDIRVSEFRSTKSKALRAHKHDWDKTTEPNGFAHLNSQLRDCEPWQFELTANEHGRVHGILLDEVFYVVWMDPKHQLY